MLNIFVSVIGLFLDTSRRLPKSIWEGEMWDPFCRFKGKIYITEEALCWYLVFWVFIVSSIVVCPDE